MKDNTKNTSEYQEMRDFSEEAYLNYSMYVILDRALPHISDGLKPVQRRIVYAMHKLSLNHKSKYKKAARTVGDVLGKYHPHGDSACYEAMVLMAQPFSYRNPLIDGQGNWGSADDPKSFAAMRYTEAKLTKYSSILLDEINQGTSEYKPNFDGTEQEPIYLPAQVPNILLNPSTGIAVGMASDTPPHNLREVINATIAVLNGTCKTTADVTEHILAPDYPTECEIINSKQELLDIYENGRGSIKTRAKYHIEGNCIVITSLPFQASGAKILEQIANQMRDKKLPHVVDLKDESDHENPTRLVVVTKSNKTDPEIVINHLFATTDLQKSQRVNFNIVGLDGRPRVKTLYEIINEWLMFRKDVVLKKLNFKLKNINERLHILQGLLIAFLNLDEVIRIIREEEDPKLELINRFSLTSTQADSILDTKLRNLAKLEQVKLESEQSNLDKEAHKLKEIINSDTRLKTLIKKELITIANEYGDDRRCNIAQRAEAKPLSDAELTPSEQISVVVSENGWIKAGKGHNLDLSKTTFKSGDALLQTIEMKSNDTLGIMGSSGKIYNILVNNLQSLKGQGEPLSGKIKPQAGESFSYFLNLENLTEEVFISSSSGYGFITSADELRAKMKAGKNLITVGKSASPLRPLPIDPDKKEICLCVSSSGRMLAFDPSEIPTLSKGKGNKLISIPKNNFDEGERLICVAFVAKNQPVTLCTGKKKFKLTPDQISNFQGTRGRRGASLPKEFRGKDDITIQA